MAINVGTLFATIGLRDTLSRDLIRAVGNLRAAARAAGLHTDSISSAAARMADRVGGSFAALGVGVTASVVRLGTQITLAAGKLALLGATAAAAAHGVVVLGSALAPAVGALAALPGAAALGAAALATLAVGLYGVQDAFKAALGDDRAKFEESLAQLAPAAQAAARELRALKPTLDALRRSVQEALFAPLAGQLSAVAQVLLGPLWTGMSSVAAEIGRAGARVAEFARSGLAVNAVIVVFERLRSIVSDLQVAVEPLLTGFTKLAIVGADFTASLAPGIAQLAVRVGEFLSSAADSGRAFAWMQGAVEVFRQLGQIALDVWRIISGVFDAMRAAGGDALGVLGTLVGSIADFVSSGQGQQTLVSIFVALRTAALALAPVLAAMAVGVGQLAPILGQLALLAGPILTGAVQALVPALAALQPGLLAVFNALGQGVAAVGPALLVAGQALSVLMVAASPLLPVIGQLAALIVGSLAAGIATTLPSIHLLVAALGQTLIAAAPLVPLLVGLAASLINNLLPAILPLLPQVALLISHLATGLLPALQPLIALAAQAAEIVGTFLVAAFSQLTAAVVPLLPDLTTLTVIAGTALLTALRDLGPHLLSIIRSFTDLLPVILPLLPPLLQLTMQLLPPLVSLVDAVARLLRGDLTGALGTAGRAIVDFLGVVGQLGWALLEGLWHGIQAAGAWFRDVIFNFFRTLMPDWVRQALGIHSPSRVFAGIGEQTMLGMRAGMLATSRQVLTAAADIAEDLASSFRPELTADMRATGQSVTGSGRAGTTVIHVTAYNPQAEATSDTINRGLALAGMLGVV
ncbi:hypothetical protein [Nonomuraea sp. LPB2021202275-12-8]|uniref:hypothetical protein n=1 Tax=Nonomuraea sp. LPB2021202275-12-8 TaxID=3120159 RepID=UPI00300D2122